MPHVQQVDEYYMFPQRCYLCGNASEKNPIDTGFDSEEGFGAELHVYICLSCVADIAKAAGYPTRSEWDMLNAEVEALRPQVAALPEVVEELLGNIRLAVSGAAGDLLSRLPAHPSAPDSGTPGNPESTEGHDSAPGVA